MFWGRTQTLLLFMLVLLVSTAPSVVAESNHSAEPVVVRVTSYNPTSHQYTFVCQNPPGTISANYFWTVRPDTPQVEAEFFTDSAVINYSLNKSVLYHIGCQVQNATNPSGPRLRGDFHIDLRTGRNTEYPEVKMLWANQTTATFQCFPPTNTTRHGFSSYTSYNTHWTLQGIAGVYPLPQYDNQAIVNITTPFPLLWDVDCSMDFFNGGQWLNYTQWGYPIEYFKYGLPYVPNIAGCVPDEPCPWNITIPPPVQNQTVCYNSVEFIPATCTGGVITSDTWNGGRQITCAQGGNSVSISGWNKPDNTFEMNRQATSGVPPRICLGSTCIQNNGFAKSGTFPICIATNSTNQTNQTNQTGNGTNLPPLPPTWFEPTGQFNLSPYDFHIHIYPLVDPENNTHVATDFEIWDVNANQRVWKSLHNMLIKEHIHNADGTFEGNRAGLMYLNFNTDYRVRARGYAMLPNGTEQTGAWSEWRNFHTREEITSNSPFVWTAREGYTIELIAENVSVPVNVAIAPTNLYGSVPQSRRPQVYVTQLYGQVGVIRNDGTYGVFADNLLNYDTFGSLPGAGETGVDGLYVDPNTGYVYISLVEANTSALNNFQGKVMRFIPNSSGDGYSSVTTILNHLTVVPSHHVHTITRGPDGKLYLSTGDAFQQFHARDPAWTSGKILRFNEDGSIPADNPVPGKYFWAGGFRNPFGAAWRPGTNDLWVTNNGEDSNDGVYVVNRGELFEWCNVICDTLNGTWFNWSRTVSPTAGIFNPGGNTFPNDTTGSYYVALSGETYTPGPDGDGKRIMEFKLNPDGSRQSVEELITYTGDGYGAPIGLAFGTKGLYFTDIYGEQGFVGVGETRGNVYLVKPGVQVPINQSSGFVTGIGPAPWFPQGLNMIWKCAPTGGSGSYTYSFTFGDGQQSPDNYPQDNIWHTYAANGTYQASCTVRDTVTQQTATATTTLVLGGVILPPPSGNQTNTTGNQTNTTACYTSVQNIPATCTGGTITSDAWNGGRTIVCAQGGNSVTMTAWDKPDNTFEMNRQASSGAQPTICIGTTCMTGGFAKSGNFPICVNTGNQTPPTTQNVTISSSTPSGTTVNIAEPNSQSFTITLSNPSSLPTAITWRKDGVNQTSSFNQMNYQFAGSYSTAGTYEILVTVQSPQNTVSKLWTLNVANTVQQNQTNTTCYNSVQNIPATCAGGTITQDTWNGGRTIVCASGGNSVTMTAWDKSDGTFEMNRQATSGVPPKICIDTTCIQNNGFAKSGQFPICVNGTNTPPADTTAPVVTNPLPSGQLVAGTTSTTLQVTTNEVAACRYASSAGMAFASMNPFSSTDSTAHAVTISGLTNGNSYSYYVKCRDLAGNTNTADTTISFSVASAGVPTAAVGIAPWFPQGRSYVFLCNATGMTPTSYDFVFGDGNQALARPSNDVYYTYGAAGNYGVTCTARNGATSVTSAALPVAVA